jgi:hypothetical protein
VGCLRIFAMAGTGGGQVLRLPQLQTYRSRAAFSVQPKSALHLEQADYSEFSGESTICIGICLSLPAAPGAALAFAVRGPSAIAAGLDLDQDVFAKGEVLINAAPEDHAASLQPRLRAV